MEILWTPSPNHGPRKGVGIKAIVWHTMVGTMQGTARWFHVGQTPAPERADKPGGGMVSAHFGIAKNGDVHQYVALANAAWHCGNVYKPRWGGLVDGVNPNLYTIGVEFEGNGDKEVLTDRQLVQAGKLLYTLTERYSGIENIPHRSINGKKTCPGSKFQIELLRSVARIIYGSRYFKPEEFLRSIK